ncbi:MAG: NUDIX domain-containing protein [Actinomycetaceae bacterium]|nr:NUDIX domain-containing protein [Actinomycetaceae bacterium]
MLERENEWPIGPDGLPTRSAARVILLTENNMVLLIRGHDFNAPSASWWFTVGGGQEPNETVQQTAIRECFEETGYRLQEKDLEGPVIYRNSKFFFADRTRRQIEHFFIARVPEFSLSTQRWTRDENQVLDEMRWFPIESLTAVLDDRPIYPQLLPTLLKEWSINGWDGQCVKIEE